MELDRDIYCGFKVTHKALGLVRSEQSRHILDTDRISASLFYPLCIIHIILMCEHFTESIGDSYLSVSLLLLCSLDSCLKVSDIVERIKDTDDIDTVCYGFLNEILNKVVCIMTVAKHILASEKHLELGVGHLFSDDPKSLPGILVKKSDAGVKSSSAPALRGIKADLIDLGKDRSHIVE